MRKPVFGVSTWSDTNQSVQLQRLVVNFYIPLLKVKILCYPKEKTIILRGVIVHIKHYVNIPVQYTAIFHGFKNDNFQSKYFYYFHIFAQTIDGGYTLEPPQCGGSNEYPQSMF